MSARAFAFVAPRYGESILGGAEALARGLAERLAARGDRVEVFSTCAVDHVSMRNALPAGEAVERGVRVRRFPIQPATAGHMAERDRMLGPARPDAQAQFDWIHAGAHSPELYAALARDAAGFDLIFVIPYLFPLCVYAAAVAPERTIAWPCLHDEPFADSAPARLFLSGTRGVMCNAPPELDLTRRVLGGAGAERLRVVGFGLESATGDAGRFRARSAIDAPFLLYSGRYEAAKNVPLLVDWHTRYTAGRPGAPALVMMGAGDAVSFDGRALIDLGFQRGQAKLDAYAAALALVQPSVNESFSIVLMEAWQHGVPALVHADCAVTRFHAERSGGGLWFRHYDEFEAVLDWLRENPNGARALGENGRRYVAREYGWDAVLRRFDAAVAAWLALSA